MNEGVVLYGAGFNGGRVFERATNMNIPVLGFVDKDAERIELFKGVMVYTFEDAFEKFRECSWIITIEDKRIKSAIGERLSEKNILWWNSLEDFYVGEKDFKADLKEFGEKGFDFKVATKYLQDAPLVYSFGVGVNWTFEQQLGVEKQGAVVYMFDPSPYVIKEMGKINLPRNIIFESVGLSDKDEQKQFHVACIGDYSEYKCSWTKEDVVNFQTRKLSSIMLEKGHRKIDLLKMDIEGSEFIALPDIFESKVEIDQICLETHARIFSNSIEKMKQLKKMFNDNGFSLVCNDIGEQTYVAKRLLNNR